MDKQSIEADLSLTIKVVDPLVVLALQFLADEHGWTVPELLADLVTEALKANPDVAADLEFTMDLMNESPKAAGQNGSTC
jgi:hypothetical protein